MILYREVLKEEMRRIPLESFTDIDVESVNLGVKKRNMLKFHELAAKYNSKDGKFCLWHTGRVQAYLDTSDKKDKDIKWGDIMPVARNGMTMCGPLPNLAKSGSYVRCTEHQALALRLLIVNQRIYLYDYNIRVMSHQLWKKGAQSKNSAPATAALTQSTRSSRWWLLRCGRSCTSR